LRVVLWDQSLRAIIAASSLNRKRSSPVICRLRSSSINHARRFFPEAQAPSVLLQIPSEPVTRRFRRCRRDGHDWRQIQNRLHQHADNFGIPSHLR